MGPNLSGTLPSAFSSQLASGLTLTEAATCWHNLSPQASFASTNHGTLYFLLLGNIGTAHVFSLLFFCPKIITDA